MLSLVHGAREPVRAPSRTAARAHLARQLARFAPSRRPAVAALAAAHPRLLDLALSFPALLFALAVPRARFEAAPVIAGVTAGAPLATLAAEADLPLWTRKLGPEAFVDPLPALPDDPMFRRRVANHLPTPKLAARWLTLVADTAFWGDANIALWFARALTRGELAEPRKPRRGYRARPRQTRSVDCWPLLTLWAWHASRRDTRAHAHVVKPWSPEMQINAAWQAAFDWRDSVGAELELGTGPLTDLWGEAALVDGFSFEPVTDMASLIASANAFGNCARGHAAELGCGHVRIWVMRREGKPLAMLELGYRYGGDPLPSIRELSGPNNADAPAEAWLAARAWLAAQNHLPRTGEPERDPAAPPHAHWLAMWRDYWLAKRRIPEWLPLAPQRYGWAEIRRPVL